MDRVHHPRDADFLQGLHAGGEVGRETTARGSAGRAWGVPDGLLARRGVGQCKEVREMREIKIKIALCFRTPIEDSQRGKFDRGFAHGGLMATLLDETLGTALFVQWAAGCATVELSMRYEKPLPIPAVVLCRSWIERTEGRKVWIGGVIEDGEGLVFVRAQSLFIKFRERL